MRLLRAHPGGLPLDTLLAAAFDPDGAGATVQVILGTNRTKNALTIDRWVVKMIASPYID